MAPAASTAHDGSALGGAHFVPAEVESRGDEGGGLDFGPPAPRPSWLRRTRVALKESVWAPVAFKLVGLVLGMLALYGVGVASILSGANGVQVPLASMLGSDIHAAWLANKSAASSRAPASALANAQTASTTAAPTAARPLTPTDSTETAAPTAGSTRAPGIASAGMTEDGKVILNAASIEDLRHLPGVGQKRADAILALRARLGRFKQVNDLLRVKGIGVRGLKKILPHVVLDAPKPAV